MRKRMLLMLLACSVVLGLIFGYKAVGNHFMNQFFDEMSDPPATVTAGTVEERTWTRQIPAVGNLAAVQGAMLPARADGEVVGIHFRNGQQVEQGDLLFELEAEAEKAERDRLAAQLDIARTEADRLVPLRERDEISESELQQALSEVAQARAALAMQEAMLERKQVRAPFSGVVGLRQVNLGEYVSPGTAMVNLQSFDPIFLNFTLPEQRLGDLNAGQAVRLKVDAYPDTTFAGEVTAIEADVSSSTRTVEFQAELPNEELKLRPGMFGRVQVDLGEPRSVQVIPRTAVQFNPFGNLVFVISEDEDDEDTLRVRQRLIQTGETRGDVIEVTEGLENGERIATSGLLKLRNDQPVEINDNPDLQPQTDDEPTPANR